MRIVSAAIANFVEVRDSMLYMLGGFPEWWNVTQLPTAIIMGVGVVVEIEPAELSQDLMLDVAIRAVDGEDLADGRAKFRRDEEDGHIANSPYYVPLAWNFAYEVIAPGPHEVAISNDGLLLELVRFGLRVS